MLEEGKEGGWAWFSFLGTLEDGDKSVNNLASIGSA